MLNFREFLEARQMMLFSTAPKELYHGTVTGRGDANLRSFQSQGITARSKGYGQGAGFFVYSDISSARKHAVGLAGGKGSYRTHMDNSGKPMVVTVEAVLEPDEWDLDYEMNFKVVMDYLIRNFEAVKDKLQSDDISVEKATMGLRPWEKPEYYSYRREEPHPLATKSAGDEELELEPMENHLPMDVADGLKDRPVGFRLRARGSRPIAGTIPSRSREVWHYGRRQEDSGLTSDGESVGIIMNMLKSNDPNAVRSFEELFFSNMGAGVAVKYVGSQPLKTKRIEVAATEGNMMTNQAVDDNYWRAV